MTKAQTITKNTLLPLGVVIALVTATWAIATDRQVCKERIQQNSTAIDRHESAIDELRGKLNYLTQGMARVETKLGTLPRRLRGGE